MSEENTRATKKQQELLSFVVGFIKQHDYGPSYREIMNALGYKSVSTVAVHVEGLITKGYLERRDNSPRSLAVVARGHTDSAAVLEIKAKISQLTDETDGESRQILEKALTILRS